MNANLHPEIVEHAQRIAKFSSISLTEAIDRIAKERPEYYRKLPLFSRVREKHPPFAVPAHFVRTLRIEAKKLRDQSGIQYTVALDNIAFHAGFHEWKHVMKMANQYEQMVVKAIESGLVFALWYPQNPWDKEKWNPNILEPFGFVHDPRIFYSAAEQLKNCYMGEDGEGGPYGLGSPVTQEDGSVKWNTRTEVFLQELRADEYRENNLPDLHFFRFNGAVCPTSLDNAREIIEAALGPVRWRIQEFSSPPEPVSLSARFAGETPSMPSSTLGQISPAIALPPIGDRSNVRLHIPIVHYVWLRGQFFELDFYNY